MIHLCRPLAQAGLDGQASSLYPKPSGASPAPNHPIPPPMKDTAYPTLVYTYLQGFQNSTNPAPLFPRCWDPTIGSSQAKLGLSTIGGENLKGGMPWAGIALQRK
jgi:hypothetical protein